MMKFSNEIFSFFVLLSDYNEIVLAFVKNFLLIEIFLLNFNNTLDLL